MNMNENEYNDLVAKLSEAAKAYYKDGSSEMSDADFDAGIRLAKEYEKENGISGSITSQVGAGYVLDDSREKVKHEVPMLSLDNTFDYESTRVWAERRQSELGVEDTLWSVEAKVDGSGCSVKFEDGKPTVFATRGTGEIGENVTDALFQVQLPTFDEGNFTVRGEIVFTDEQYANATAKRIAAGEGPYLNSRNAVSGIIGTQAKHRKFDVEMTMICYDAIGIEGNNSVEVSDKLEKMGFITTLGLGTSGHTVEEIPAAIEALEKRQNEFGFLLDGVVIKLQDFDYRDELGVSSKNVKWGISYKFPAKVYTSTVRAIHTAIGKTGRCTYQIMVDPVKLEDGTTITYASGHNLKFLRENNIGVGNSVEIRRMGGVIPRASNGEGETSFEMLKLCPQCKQPFELEDPDTYQFCTTDECSIQGILEYACGKDVFDCKGVSEGFIERCLDVHGWIKNLADFMSLTREQIGKVEGYEMEGGGAKGKATGRSGDIVFEALQTARTRPLDRVIASFILPSIGTSVSRLLASHFGSLDALRNATAEEIAKIDKIGPKKSEGAVTKLAKLSPMIDRLVTMGFQTEAEAIERVEVVSNNNPLFGKVCYATGKLPISKKEAQLVVEKCGGVFKQSSKTKIIIGCPSAKVDKFIAKGCKHIDIDIFMELAESVS